MTEALCHVAWAPNGPAGEMMATLLRNEGIQVLVRRSGGSDNPEFMAGGGRELLVRPGDEARAKELVAAYFG